MVRVAYREKGSLIAIVRLRTRVSLHRALAVGALSSAFSRSNQQWRAEAPGGAP